MLRTIAHAVNESKPAHLHKNFAKDGPMEGSEVEEIIASVMNYQSTPSEDLMLTREEALELMNEKHAIVMEAGKTIVIREEYNNTMKRMEIIRSSFEDITKYHRRKLVILRYNEDGEPVTMPLGKWWLNAFGARHYPKVAFSPQQDVGDAYNLWRGFGADPIEGECGRFWDHIGENICQGNNEHYQYVRKWLARAFQEPGKQGETAIVFRGPRGVGKSITAKTAGKLFGQHYLPISNSRHLTGNFNAHLQDAVLLFGDEAFWAGDKQGESVLKTLITESWLLIEPKGINSFLAKNCLHIMLASNNDWVVPAGPLERRFLVLDVGTSKQGDHSYFGKFMEQMENGGYEALLYELLQEDISDFNFRKVPKTQALLEQQLRTQDTDHKWLFGKLYDGKLKDDHDTWEREISKRELQQDYVKTCTDMRASYISDKTALGMFLNKMIPSLKTAQRSGRKCYIFPPLEECRKNFADKIGQKIDWPNEQEEEEAMRQYEQEVDDDPM